MNGQQPHFDRRQTMLGGLAMLLSVACGSRDSQTDNKRVGERREGTDTSEPETSPGTNVAGIVAAAQHIAEVLEPAFADSPAAGLGIQCGEALRTLAEAAESADPVLIEIFDAFATGMLVPMADWLVSLPGGDDATDTELTMLLTQFAEGQRNGATRARAAWMNISASDSGVHDFEGSPDLQRQILADLKPLQLHVFNEGAFAAPEVQRIVAMVNDFAAWVGDGYTVGDIRLSDPPLPRPAPPPDVSADACDDIADGLQRVAWWTGQPSGAEYYPGHFSMMVAAVHIGMRVMLGTPVALSLVGVFLSTIAWTMTVGMVLVSTWVGVRVQSLLRCECVE